MKMSENNELNDDFIYMLPVFKNNYEPRKSHSMAFASVNR